MENKIASFYSLENSNWAVCPHSRKCHELVAVVAAQSILDAKEAKPSLKITGDVNFKHYRLMVPFLPSIV